MASNHTQNYGLNQWQSTDQVLCAEFTADNEKVDAALAQNRDNIAAVQTQAAADLSTAKTELTTRITTVQNSLNSALTAGLAAKGNCRVVTGTYVGVGAYNSPTPNTLTFDAPPLLLFVHTVGKGFSFWAGYGETATISTYGVNTAWLMLTWNGSTVTWYNSENADRQLNTAGTTYRYIALMAA